MNRRLLIEIVNRFLQEDDGPTATEYAVMMALILLVAVGTITTFGLGLQTSYQTSIDTMFGASS